MIKRRAKRTTRKILIVISLFLLGGAFIVVMVAILVQFNSLFKNSQAAREEIVKPIGAATATSDVKGALHAKGFITDSVVESSASAAIVATLRDGPIVYFSKSKEADFQVESLQLITQRLKIDNKKPILIDLRTTRPIVKF